MPMTTHKMLLISTGGTIAGEVATSKKGEEYEIAKADAFSEVIRDTVTYLNRSANIELQIDPEEFSEVDSSDIKPDHWSALAELIYKKYDDYDSFVITHGTNTLGYTCAALSFALPNPNKPIILTGSQVPINQPGSDAKMNLDNAIRLATWKHHDIRGVICVFGSHIITGTRVKKDTEFDYDAFKSFHQGSIGRIGRIIDINKNNLENHHNKYHTTTSYPLGRTRESLLCESDFETNILSITEFPGMDYSILSHLHEERGYKGFIVRAFGAGDMSTSSLDVLRDLKNRKVPVVVTTQAPNGNATLQVNEPGQKLAAERLVIPAYNMSIESQTAKLMWLLGKLGNRQIDFNTLVADMTKDIRGEINIIWELEYGQ